MAECLATPLTNDESPTKSPSFEQFEVYDNELPLITKKKRSASSQFFLKFQGGTVTDGILTLLAATIGTGILMIPNAMAASGTTWSAIQMIICAVISYSSLLTIVVCGKELSAYSYQDIALQTYGHWCRQLVNIVSFFANWGSIILYLKLTAELFAVVDAIFLKGYNLPIWLINPKGKILPIIIATIFVLPLSISKELKALRYFCLINILFVFFFCYVVIAEAFDYQPIMDSFKTTSPFILSGFSTTFPSAVFAYMSHTNVLDVFKELKRPTVEKMEKIVRWTILFVLVSYVLIGLIGYATFSQNMGILSNSNMSNGVILIAYGYNLDQTRRPYPTLIVICMIAMCFSIIISQPYNIKPAKEGLVNFFKPLDNASRDNSEESFTKRLIFVLITLYSAVIVTIYSSSIQLIMNIIGSSFFSVICFIMPSMFYLKIREGRISTTDKVVHGSMLVFNAIFTIWNTGYNISQALS